VTILQHIEMERSLQQQFAEIWPIRPLAIDVLDA
jgi:hypothetical protein